MNREIKCRIRLQEKETGEKLTLFNSIFDAMIGVAWFEIDRNKWAFLGADEFTGLLDKNGKEIYEGDVVVLSLSKDSGANGADGIIEWSKMASQWWIRFNYDKKRYKELTPDYGDENYYCQYLEITGNIYETPPYIGTK